jgi:hypothetical protein
VTATSTTASPALSHVQVHRLVCSLLGELAVGWPDIVSSPKPPARAWTLLHTRVQAAPAGEVQQPPVTAGVGRGISAGQDGADGADGGCGEGFAVGVDADDAVDSVSMVMRLFSSGRTTVTASAWVESPRGGTAMSHAGRRTGC